MEDKTYLLDEDLPSGVENSIPVSPAIRSQLNELHVWARIMAVANFISAGLQVFTLLAIYSGIRRLFLFDPTAANNFALAVIILFLLSVVFSTLVGWHLWLYSDHLKRALLYDDNDHLDLSYYYQYRYFKTLGWMTICTIAVFLIAVAIFISSDIFRMLT